MTVYDNLAFPLRNRSMPEPEVDKRVREIAHMLELDATLKSRAAGLTADGKQKISLGRGLVRSDVNVIMFDEPLTVIDPHLKWVLRSKLKELHQRIRRTMIYVTHDQTEALTFADQVVVMNNGEVVQTGTPVELFERPMHTFVGHFIGSPGMNVLTCEVKDGKASFDGHPVETINAAAYKGSAKRLELGVRPEFVSLAKTGIPATVAKVADAGRFRIVETRAGHTTDQAPGARRRRNSARPGASRLRSQAHADLRRWLDGGGAAMNKTFDNKAWWFVVPVFLMVALNALIPLMTVVNFSVQETFRRQCLHVVGRYLVRAGASFRAVPRCPCCARSSLPPSFLPSRFRLA